MSQELLSETTAFTSAFNKTRNVCHYELCVIVDAHNTKVWLECGERIIRDLWLCSRHCADECTFACVRETNQRNIGHQFEFKCEPTLISFFTLFGKCRSATFVVQELCVTATTTTTGSREPFVAVLNKVGQNFTGVHVARNCSLGNMNDEVFASSSMEVFTFAVNSVASASVRVVSKCQKRRHVTVGQQPHIAALAAIAAVWPTHRFRTFATETDASSAAVSAPHIQLGFIDKHAHRNPQATSARYSNSATHHSPIVVM